MILYIWDIKHFDVSMLRTVYLDIWNSNTRLKQSYNFRARQSNTPESLTLHADDCSLMKVFTLLQFVSVDVSALFNLWTPHSCQSKKKSFLNTTDRLPWSHLGIAAHWMRGTSASKLRRKFSTSQNCLYDGKIPTIDEMLTARCKQAIATHTRNLKIAVPLQICINEEQRSFVRFGKRKENSSYFTG